MKAIYQHGHQSWHMWVPVGVHLVPECTWVLHMLCTISGRPHFFLAPYEWPHETADKAMRLLIYAVHMLLNIYTIFLGLDKTVCTLRWGKARKISRKCTVVRWESLFRRNFELRWRIFCRRKRRDEKKAQSIMNEVRLIDDMHLGYAHLPSAWKAKLLMWLYLLSASNWAVGFRKWANVPLL